MDMEITTETVSRLILGHLHFERNKSTYNEYLTSCHYLRKYVVSSSKRRPHIITRFRGLNLLEVLQEYAAVYNLVQEYLEGVGYFRNHKSTCLLDEVEFLLNLTGAKFEGNRSRSSTPFRVCSPSPLQPNNNLSPIIETTTAESDVNTTALQDLPGNSREVSRTRGSPSGKDISASSSRETPLRNNIHNGDKNSVNEVQCQEVIDDEDSPVKSTNSTTKDCSLERIQQTILDHPEFQAKIAENINSIINASVHSASKESNAKATTKVVTELDSTIKMILQKTEEDPLFEQLLEDLIGDATSVSSQIHLYNDATDLHTPKKLPSSDNAVNIKQRLRSSRKSITTNDTLGIEICNNDIIDKIVAVATAGTVLTTPVNNMSNANVNNETNEMIVPVRTTSCQNQSISTTKNSISNAEVIIYDGPIDTLFHQNTSANIQSHPNPAPAGLLMLQPQQHQTSMMSVDSNICNSSYVTTVSNISSNDVARSQQQPFYMISDTGDVISVPQQMIVCTTDAATMLQPQQYTVTQTQQTMPSAGGASKYVTQPNESSSSTLVDLFSNYKATESSTITKTRKQNTKASDKYPVKRIKTILPMPTYRIDILPMPEEDATDNSKIITEVAASAAESTSDDGMIDDNSAVSNVKENISSSLNVSSTSANCHVTPMVVTPEVPTRKSITPKSGSHVRVLDFNFVTPVKEAVDISTKPYKKDAKNGKSVKSLFTSPSITTTKKCTQVKSWDANLRELAVPCVVTDVPKQPDVIQKKASDAIQQQPAEVPKLEDVQKMPLKEYASIEAAQEAPYVDKLVNLNNTVQDAESIERVLLMDENNEPQSEQAVIPKKSPRKPQKHCSQIVKKSLRIRKKSDTVQKLVEKNECSPNTVEAADTLLKLSKPSLKEKLNQTEAIAVQIQPQGSSTPIDQQSTATPPSTTKSRIKRKCNIDSSIKQEVTVTRVKEIKSLDILTESGAKLILSPSKLANKRSLVTEPSGSAVMDLTKTIMNMPTLETPIKFNPCNNPETPNIFPSQILASETPFTKMFNEQTEGVDISAIPTPKLPITPSLNLMSPFNIDQIGCFNRPTDYSTSSSYYQPSDSEQNKSLEKQIIEECKRLETGKKMPPCNQVITQTDVLDEMDKEDKQQEVDDLEAIAAAMKTIKTSIGIGRKNLNLMNPKVRSNSETSSDANSLSSSSSSSSSDSDSDESVCDNTLIRNSHKETTIGKRKSRTTSPVGLKTSEPFIHRNVCQDISTILSSTNFKAELKVILPEITLTQQQKVLKDMEVKRKRTIAKFKGKEVKKIPTKGVVTRSSRGRLIKPIISSASEVPPKSKSKQDVPAKDPTVNQPIKDKPKPKLTKTPSTKRVTKSKSIPRSTKRRSPLKTTAQSKLKLAPPPMTDLDPLDIVETHLSEHSADSTPVAAPEEQLALPAVKKQTQQESQSILNMILTSAMGREKQLAYKTVKSDKCSRVGGGNVSRVKEKEGVGKERKGVGSSLVAESKVSPDLEAEKLVKGLKQWGIHLIPKSKSNETSTTEDNHEKNVPKETVQNTSWNNSDNTDPNVFDDKQYSENDIIKFTFDPTAARIVKSYNLEVLNRKFTSRIFIEDVNDDVDIPLSVSPFECIFDLPADNSTAEVSSTRKVEILEEVIVVPKICSNNAIRDESKAQKKPDKLLELPKSIEECSKLERVILTKTVVETNSDFLRRNVDEMPKNISDFQMIKDMQAKLDSSCDATPRRDDDSLYDFALTDIGKAEGSPSKLLKKRPLNGPAADEQCPKRPKIDHELLLQELSASDKKRSSKSMLPSSLINAKSKSDRQLLERIDVEQFLSVLHP